ncbi:Protein Y40B10A.5 [Aphelenchoides avenae]|nr:Protein Y40B10A.5 [Aphelenchus avenae]
MSGQSSANATPPPGYAEYESEFFLDMPLLLHIFITLVMLLSAICDTYFMMVLLVNKKLRSQKENVIFVGNILFDLLHHINGFSVHFNIIVPMIAKPKYVPLITQFDCLKRLPGILVFLTMPGSGTIVFVTTVDRLIAVTFPLHYIRLGLTYAGAMVAAAFALTMPTFVIGWVDLFIYPDGYLIPNCDQDYWVTSRNFLVSQCLVVSTTAAAAVIYFPILYKVYRKG